MACSLRPDWRDLLGHLRHSNALVATEAVAAQMILILLVLSRVPRADSKSVFIPPGERCEHALRWLAWLPSRVQSRRFS